MAGRQNRPHSPNAGVANFPSRDRKPTRNGKPFNSAFRCAPHVYSFTSEFASVRHAGCQLRRCERRRIVDGLQARACNKHPRCSASHLSRPPGTLLPANSSLAGRARSMSTQSCFSPPRSWFSRSCRFRRRTSCTHPHPTTPTPVRLGSRCCCSTVSHGSELLASSLPNRQRGAAASQTSPRVPGPGRRICRFASGWR